MITLYSDPTGPLIQYGGGLLVIEDLNPEVKTRWRMSRWEMFKLGRRCIASAFGFPPVKIDRFWRTQ